MRRMYLSELCYRESAVFLNVIWESMSRGALRPKPNNTLGVYTLSLPRNCHLFWGEGYLRSVDFPLRLRLLEGVIIMHEWMKGRPPTCSKWELQIVHSSAVRVPVAPAVTKHTRLRLPHNSIESVSLSIPQHHDSVPYTVNDRTTWQAIDSLYQNAEYHTICRRPPPGRRRKYEALVRPRSRVKDDRFVTRKRL